MDIKGYNCPNCGGIVRFDIAEQKAVCRSCGAAFEREALSDYQPGAGAGGEDTFDYAAAAVGEYRQGTFFGGGDEDTFDCAAAFSGGYQQGTAFGSEDTFDCAAASSGGYQQGTAFGNEDTFDCAAASPIGYSGDEDSFDCTGWAVWENPEDDDLATGACPSCGAELYGGKTTVAMVCPCCGNAQIVAKRIQGMLKPDSIIPFKHDKNTAIEAYEKFCGKRKRLLPNRFIKENRLDAVQGVYAPFWLFDAEVEGRFEYEATTREKRGKNNYVTIYHYVEREGGIAFKKIPVDGSEKMNDDYMDAIEPFEYDRLVDFHPSYLAGYAAEKYDVDAQKSKKRAQYRMEATIEKLFKDTVRGYSTVTVMESDIRVKKGNVSYALFPVWTVNAIYDDDNWLFMMNGQTGKMVGRLPYDEGKAWKYRGIFTALFLALCAPILYYLNMVGVLGSIISFCFVMALSLMGAKLPMFALDVPLPFIIIMSFIISAVCGCWIVRRWIYNMDTAREQTEADDYVVPGSFDIWVRIDERIS